MDLRRQLLWLFLFLYFPLFGQQTTECSDCAAYEQAKQQLHHLRNQPGGGNPGALVTAHTTLLDYHRRRMDADSILPAAQHLLRVAPAGSRAAAFAVFSIAEAHITRFDWEPYQQARAQLEAGNFPTALQPLVDFYLLVLDARDDQKISLNAERGAIRAVNAIEQARRFHPEMIPDLTVAYCEALKYLGLIPVIYEQLNAYRALANSSRRDELDALKFAQGEGRIFYHLGRFQRSHNLLEASAAQMETHAKPVTGLKADSYYFAGEACYEKYRDERCVPLFEKALQYKRRRDYHEMYIAILYHTRQYDKAVDECQRVFTEVIEGFTPAGPLDNPTLAGKIVRGQLPGNLMMWKGRALYKKSIGLEDDQEAVPLLECGMESAERGRILHNRILFGADGYNIGQLILNNQNTYGLGYQFRIAYQLWQRTGKHEHRKLFFRYMEMRKNYMLSDAFSQRHLPPEEKARLDQATREVENAEYAFLQGGNEKEVRSATREALEKGRALDRVVADLKNRYPRPVQDHADLEYADPDEIQRGLDDSTAFVIYAEQWHHYYVYSITSERQQLIKIFDGGGIQDRVERFLKSAASPLQEQRSRREKFISRSHDMYQLYVKPIESELAGKSRLILVPEESSGRFPFEILVKNDEQKPYAELDYLVKDLEMTYHYSATFYDKVRARPSVTNGAYLGFAPVFSDGGVIPEQVRSSRIFMSRFYKSIRGKKFTALPGTEREVTAIADLLPPTAKKSVLLHGAATASVLAGELREDYQYVHIATHGLMSLFDPRRSAFACYDSESNSGAFLFAHYIESLDLRPDLAVLSSCESGVGLVLEGENLIALSRSFLAAGAKNILYSLWKVDDRASSDLMIDFYANHLGGQSYASSIRAAKLRLLSNPATAAPRFWAPFVLMGE